MKVNLKITNLNKFKSDLNSDKLYIDRELRKIIRLTAFDVEGNAKKEIQQGVKTGRVYQKYRPRRKHRASAKGQAPATDTGRLVNSITSEVIKGGREAIVEAKTKYARILEELKDRPFLDPALKKALGKLERRLEIMVARLG